VWSCFRVVTIAVETLQRRWHNAGASISSPCVSATNGDYACRLRIRGTDVRWLGGEAHGRRVETLSVTKVGGSPKVAVSARFRASPPRLTVPIKVAGTVPE
jgi:hypothetical protein